MPTRETAWSAGAPCWVDCAFEAEHRGMHHARDFYGKLFGWHIVQDEEHGYAICLKDERPVAALVTKTDQDQPTSWTTYLASADVDASAAAIEEAGGRTVLAPGDVGDSGRAAYFTDPTGAYFGVWQARQHTGFGLVDEPGSVTHSSLLTRDLEASKTFYAKAFGYTYADESDAHATILLSDGSTGGGIHRAGQLPDDAPPTWLVHFAVADRDSSAQMAQELGATILMTVDTPGGPEAVLQGQHGEVFNITALPD
ncbi:VOC family protein [Leekyejoonella antrihumi]|uniref:VOC family protein n=1 Tax=Leekyejoonella antrihumi TaxID=1660198 RepID=A0A563E5V3_9MICO|nr:VOC family protein [Leekyejoonella antrihumi]TWP37897.1 VOC family protein [Leekyejoonella antrihumi]